MYVSEETIPSTHIIGVSRTRCIAVDQGDCRIGHVVGAVAILCGQDGKSVIIETEIVAVAIGLVYRGVCRED